MHHRLIGSVLFSALFCLASLSHAQTHQTFTYNGSTTVYSYCIEDTPNDTAALKEHILLEPTNSGRGLLALIKNETDVAMVSSPLPALLENLQGQGLIKGVQQTDFKTFPISDAELTFIVPNNSPVTSLTKQQLVDILTGAITNWQQLGYHDQSITVVAEQSSGAMYSLIKKHLLEGMDIQAKTKTIRAAPQTALAVSNIPGSIGFISSQTYEDLAFQSRPIPIEGLAPIKQQLSLVIRATDTRKDLFIDIDMFQKSCHTRKPMKVTNHHSHSKPSAAVDAGAYLEPKTLYIAMTAAFVSDNGTDVYKDISRYIAEQTGIRTKFVSNLSYSVVNRMIEDGALHVAFMCGLPYVKLHDREKPVVELLAAPVMQSALYQHQPIYYSYVIVHKDADYENFEALANTRFVYNDSLSNSGYNIPRAKLIDMGKTDGFFAEVLHSGSHEESIRMVAEKKADASAVDSLVLDYARLSNMPYANDVKIIEKLGPSAIPPVVYNPNLSPPVVAKIRQALLNMDKTAAGREILRKAYLDGFVNVQDTHYNDIRIRAQKAKQHNYSTIR